MPRETGMFRRPVEGGATVASGTSGNRSLQHHESVMPRERSALKSNLMPGTYDAAPVEPVVEQLEQRACPVNVPAQQQRGVSPSVQMFAEAAQRSSAAGHGASAWCQLYDFREPRVAPQVSSPTHPVEQKGVNPSPKACIQCARTVPGWPVQPRAQPGFAEDLSFPQRIQFDDRSVPCGGKNNRWVDAMLGRAGFVTPGHVVESTTGTLIAPAPTEAVSAPLPTISHIRSPDYPAAYGEAETARDDHVSRENKPAERVGTSGGDERRNSRGNDDGPGDGWQKVDSSRAPAPSPPPGPPRDPSGGGGGGGSGPSGGPPDGPPGGGDDDHGLLPPDMRCT